MKIKILSDDEVVASKRQMAIIANTTRPGRPGFIVVCTTNGNLYSSYEEAASDTGCDPGNISKVVSGKLKHTKGQIFRLATQQEIEYAISLIP